MEETKKTETKLVARKGTFEELLILGEKKEGLVLLGCGGDIQGWIDGVTKELHGEKILEKNKSFKDAILTESTGGRIDLTLMFPDGGIDVGKLAMWRLQFGDCSWLSDFIVNYKKHYKLAEEKPKVKLVGEDGNAFAIIGKCMKALKRAGQEENAKKFQEEATSGDYDGVLQSAMKYCEVE